MRLKTIGTKIIGWLKQSEGKVYSLLDVMSILALALVVVSQFVSSEWQVPFLSITWSTFQVGSRAMIWLLFVSSFVVYANLIESHSDHARHHIVERVIKILLYARQHMTELIICFCWIPQSHLGTLDNYVALLSMTKIVPLDILQLSGTLAHAWRVVRFTSRRFSTHPMFVTGTATTVLVSSISALLVHFEPQTFPSFWEAAWYSLTTITKSGISEAVPHTAAGRAISMILILGGWGIAGVFLGLVTGMVRSELLTAPPAPAMAAPAMTDIHQELAELKLLLETKKANHCRCCCKRKRHLRRRTRH